VPVTKPAITRKSAIISSSSGKPVTRSETPKKAVLFSGGGDGSLPGTYPTYIQNEIDKYTKSIAESKEFLAKLRAGTAPAVTTREIGVQLHLIRNYLRELEDFKRVHSTELRKYGALGDFQNVLHRLSELQSALQAEKDARTKGKTSSSSTGGRRSLGSALQWPSARLWM
jgi:hypothetical protein